MSIFDIFKSPAVRALKKLSPEEFNDVSKVVLMTGGFRETVIKKLIELFFKEIQALEINASVTQEKRQIILHEASLAIIDCTPIVKSFLPGKLNFMDQKSFMACMRIILCGEIQNRDEFKYDSESESARTQFLIRCANLLGIDNPKFSQRLSMGEFAKQWKISAETSISGIALGFSRVPEDVLSKRVGDICGEFGTAAQEKIVGFAVGFTQYREKFKSNDGAKGRESSFENSKMLPSVKKALEEILSKSEQFADALYAATDIAKGLGRPEDAKTEEQKKKFQALSGLIEMQKLDKYNSLKHAWAFFTVLVMLRKVKTIPRYQDTEEFKHLLGHMFPMMQHFHKLYCGPSINPELYKKNLPNYNKQILLKIGELMKLFREAAQSFSAGNSQPEQVILPWLYENVLMEIPADPDEKTSSAGNKTTIEKELANVRAQLERVAIETVNSNDPASTAA